jgi:hypothetical protein
MLRLVTGFEGFKLSTQHQPLLQDLRAGSHWLLLVNQSCIFVKLVQLVIAGQCCRSCSGLVNLGLINSINEVMG